MAKSKVTAGDIHEALDKSLNHNEWVLFREVRVPFGGAHRTADAIAINCWKSRGYRISGFEIKTNRKDWLRELKKPEKAEAFERYVNEWSIVSPPGVVLEGELPKAWGLMEFTGAKLVVKKKPKFLKSKVIRGDQMIPVTIMSSISRRAREMVEDNPNMRSARKKAYDSGLADGLRKSKSAEKISVLEAEIRSLKLKLGHHESAQKAAGLGEYSSWEMDGIAKHVKMIKLVSPRKIEHLYSRALRDLKGMCASLEDASSAFSEGMDETDKEVSDGRCR